MASSSPPPSTSRDADHHRRISSPPPHPPPTTQNDVSTHQIIQDSTSGKAGEDEISVVTQIRDPIGYDKSKRRGTHTRKKTISSTHMTDDLNDSFNWRRYGQKPIPGSMFPRNYYRCAHRVDGCLATKQVQKTNEDPNTYSIAYMGTHSCTQAPSPSIVQTDPPPSSSYVQSDLPSSLFLDLSLGFGGSASTKITSKDNTSAVTHKFDSSSSNSCWFPPADPGCEDDYWLDSPEFNPLYLKMSIIEENKEFVSIFSLLPTNYEFEDSFAQLWIATGCLNYEDVGHALLQSLLNEQYLLHSGSNFVTRKDRYRINKAKMNGLLHNQRGIDGRFFLWEKESQRNITNSNEIHHVSLVCNDIDPSTFQTLEQLVDLTTLLFLHHHGNNKVTQVPDNLFLSCQKLQALDLSGARIKKLSSFVGILKNLRYLDLSWTLIEWLPDTICSLDELQTLKLKGCVKLRGLPRKLKKLTKLQHLDVDVLRQFSILPGGIGALVNLRTLSAFLVGTEEGCKIQELKELNDLIGDFCIAMLENVGDGDEANEAALCRKYFLNKLELRWTASQLSRTNNNCYDVLKSLRPCRSLKELQIFCYEGSRFPDWVSDPTFSNLVSITFFNCEHVSALPLVEQLPSLRHLELVKMNGVKTIERRGKSDQAAFFRLEKLVVDEMQSLRSWNWVKTNEDDYRSLAELTINECPSLRVFHVIPSLSAIKHFEVKGCPKLESLSEMKLPDTLVELIVEDCPMIKRKYSQKGGEDWHKIKHVASIHICEEDVEDEEDDDDCL